MTEFPPSDRQEHPQAPFESPGVRTGAGTEKHEQRAPQEGLSDEAAELQSAAAETLTERLAKSVPPLIIEDALEDSPPIFDEEAWKRISPRGLYARIFRPLLESVLIGFILIPVMLTVGLIAFANWIAFRDRSKVFFKQTRVGLRAQEFEL